MQDVKRILSEHFMLKHLPAADIDRLAQMASTRHYKAGEPVFLKGDPGTAMMAVLAGRVRICSYSAEGREVVLNVINPGEVFGEIALIDGGERTADAFAMEAAELLVLSRRDFLPFLAGNPEVCIRLLEVMCARLRWTSEQLEDVNFLDLRSRLAKRLIYLWDNHREKSEDVKKRGVRIQQHTLAAMIGTSREAVNKQLRSWEESGMIDVGRGSITVLDRSRLEQIVEESM
ncbi:MAG TPA: Crp/Fnr family transcriptional regulator [Rhodospirillales bacterium]|nr:Crp/Fnr family transcriptional regulator [Rhodospirillales bacterium]